MRLQARWPILGALLGILLLAGPGLATAQRAGVALAQLTKSTSHDVRPAWSPDSSRIVFQSNRTGAYQIWLVNPDGSSERRVSRGESDDRHPSWSPDGRAILFDSGNDMSREIWSMDLDGGNRRQLTRLGAFSSFPKWSPDGRKIAFFVYRDGVMDLWLVDSAVGEPRALTSQMADPMSNGCTFACHAATWSADSSMLAFSGGDRKTVWTLALSTGSLVPVTSGREHTHFPEFTADGRLLYVQEHVNSTEAWTDVWAIDLSGQRQPELMLGKLPLQGPYELSADGHKLLFHSPRAGNFDVYLADLTAPGAREALQGPAVRGREFEEAMAAGSVATQEGVGGLALPVPLLLIFSGTLAMGAVLGSVRLLRVYRRRPRS